jgi:hypothetical protein
MRACFSVTAPLDMHKMAGLRQVETDRLAQRFAQLAHVTAGCEAPVNTRTFGADRDHGHAKSVCRGLEGPVAAVGKSPLQPVVTVPLQVAPLITATVSPLNCDPEAGP